MHTLALYARRRRLHRTARNLQVLVGEKLEVETPHPRAQLTGVAERLDGRSS